MSTLSTPPPLLSDQPLIVNWGLGKDSSAFLARVLTDPDACGIDLSRMVVLTLMPGSEWPDTLADAEKHILPLLRRRGVRYVQVARAGQSRLAGIDRGGRNSQPATASVLHCPAIAGAAPRPTRRLTSQAEAPARTWQGPLRLSNELYTSLYL